MSKTIYLKTGKRKSVKIVVENDQEEYALTILNKDTERSIKAQESYNRRFVSFEDAYEDEQTFEPKGNLPTPEEEYIKKEEIEVLYQAIKSLTTRQQEIIYKRLWEEKSLRQIGAELGLDHKTVHETFVVAKMKIKKYFEKIFK